MVSVMLYPCILCVSLLIVLLRVCELFVFRELCEFLGHHFSNQF